MVDKINMNSLRLMMLYRLPLYNKNFPLVLFWSQKSGCTTLAKWFFFQLGLLDEALQYSPWIHYYREQKYEKQLNYQANMIREISAGKKTIKLVRDPYHRALSSFLGLAKMSLLLRHRRQQEWKHIKKSLYNIKKYNDETLAESISFKQYLYYLKNNGVKIASINAHRAQQYIKHEETYVSDYIYLEDFDKSIRSIEEKYGLVNSPETIVKSGHHQAHLMTKELDCVETIITKEVFADDSLPTYDSFYDKEAIELVNEIFADDFAVYGYKKFDYNSR